MAKSKKSAASIPAPDPLPKVGDQVEYFWPETTPAKLRGKNNGAKVLAVHDGFDGRLVDLEVDTGEGLITVKRAPWRDVEDEAGNTWHWPETAETDEDNKPGNQSGNQ